VLRVPILLYHSVSDDPPPWIAPFALAPAAFDRQLELICASGMTALTVTDYAAGLEDPATLPERPVLITFDDGLADFRDAALPALQRAGLPVTLFVTTGFVEGLPAAAGTARPTGPWLDVPALRDLRDQGVELGAHSHSHPQLDTLSREAVRAELGRPKEILEELLGAPVPTFAYPHGYHGPVVRRLVEETGYSAACAVKNAFSSPADDRFALARLTIGADTSLEELQHWLDGSGAPLAPGRERAKTRGWRAYRRGRALLRRRPGSDF
jgi:peptidoglycan/xylan/chitin deacetylase (PgdA/CDA1 family)